MTTGVVIGKFYPPHKGHKFLIDTAKSFVIDLTVIVCDKKGQTIPGKTRAYWIKKIHPDVSVKITPDDLGDDDSKAWAKRTIEILGFRPDFVFTSEDYGENYAKFLGSKHIMVDKERKKVPISGTKIRENPAGKLDYLEPIVRANFIKRVVVLGAESTGTTTLSKDLANYYKTSFVPEFGRTYWEGKLHSKYINDFSTNDFVFIAKQQNLLEDEMAKFANKVLICDTNSYTTSFWHERYLDFWSKEVEKVSRKRKYDLYIITGDEIPFVQDGTRDGENIRHSMHQRFIQKLQEDKKNFILLTGSRSRRLRKAVSVIDKILQN